MTTVEVARWLGVMTVLSVGFCAAGTMLHEDLPVEGRASEILVPTALVGLVDLALFCYVVFVA